MPRKYSPEYESCQCISGYQVHECLDELSEPARKEIEALLEILQKRMMGKNFGRLAALELIGVLVKKGFI